MRTPSARKDRLRLLRALEDGATQEERLAGLSLDYAGAVGPVFEEEWESGTSLSAEVSSEGRYHMVMVSAGDEGYRYECACGLKTPCRHALALARAALKDGGRRPPPHAQPRWRTLMDKMAPARTVRIPMDGEEVFVHWIDAIPFEGKSHLLSVSWRMHRTGKRGIGRGEPVNPARLESEAARRLSEADRQVIGAAGRGFSRPGFAPGKNAVLVGPGEIDLALRALSRASFVYWEENRERAAFDPSPVMPRIKADEEGDGLKITGEWVLLDQTVYLPHMPRMFAGPNPWMADRGILRPVFGTADGAAALGIIEQGAVIGPSEIPVFLGTSLPGLIGCGAQVRVSAGLPHGGGQGGAARPRLYLAEEEGILIASLRFKYGDYEIASENPDPVLLLPRAGGDKARIERDMESELGAMKKLAGFGFSPTDDGRFSLEGERALDFVREGIPQLAADWDLFGKEDLKRHRVRPKALTLSVRISAENDWLDIWADASAGGDPVEIDRILKALKKGSRYIKLSDMSHAFIADKWAGKLSELLHDAHLGPGASRLAPYMAPVVEELAETADEVRIEKPAVWKRVKALIEGEPRLAREKPPKTLQCKLRPYQEKGYRWLRHLGVNGLGGILADDMGLGKTVQALALLLKEKELETPGPSLVVSPTSVVHNWEDEIIRHAPSLKSIRYMGQDRARLLDEFSSADVVLTSYAILRRDSEELAGVDFNYVILDEAQAIKNAATQTARAAVKLKARRKLALTGTPLENHLGELWSHMNFLMPGLLGSQKGFVKRYERPIIKGDRDALEELKKRIRPFMLRRMKSEVAPELPPKVENVLWSEFGPEQAELYAKILAAGRERVMSAADRAGVAGARPQILDLLLRLRQVACHPAVLPDGLGQGVGSAKFEQFTEFVSEVIEEGNRILVYSQFVQVLKILRKWFETAGIPHLYMDGRTKDRETVVKRFQEDSSMPAFLVSLKAGGTGLNLTGADYVLLFDPWWNPAIENQAADRAHRIGREGTVFFYRLVARGSVEEKIMRLKERKKRITDEIILSEHQWGLPSTMEELRELFED